MPNFERFAALVAAAERAKVTLAAFEVAERQVAAERERCAKICEQLQDWPEGATPYDCASAIRSAE